MRGRLGYLFNFHPAGLARHKHRFGSAPIDDYSEVVLVLDTQAFLNQDSLDHSAFRASLMGHQPAAQHLVGNTLRLFGRLPELDSSTLPATSGMNLSFNHDEAPEPFRDVASFFFRVSHLSTGHANVMLCQNRFGLVLVYFHEGTESRKDLK